MEKELEQRLAKVRAETGLTAIHIIDLVNIAIATIEAVKAHKVASGFYARSDIQACDRVSSILRTCR